MNLVDIDKRVTSNKFEHNGKSFKCFIGCKSNNIIRPICIVLSRMSGYVKYFDNDENICIGKI